jgi:pyridoxal 5'-phosphate synthase pdxS subunit
VLVEHPAKRARAIVLAVTYYDQPDKLAEISEGLGEPMTGTAVGALAEEELLQTR